MHHMNEAHYEHDEERQRVVLRQQHTTEAYEAGGVFNATAAAEAQQRAADVYDPNPQLWQDLVAFWDLLRDD